MEDIKIDRIFFRKEHDSETTAFVTILLGTEKLKIPFIISDDGIYELDGLEGSFIARIKTYLLKVYILLVNKDKDFTKTCWRKNGRGWVFVRY